MKRRLHNDEIKIYEAEPVWANRKHIGWLYAIPGCENMSRQLNNNEKCLYYRTPPLFGKEYSYIKHFTIAKGRFHLYSSKSGVRELNKGWFDDEKKEWKYE